MMHFDKIKLQQVGFFLYEKSYNIMLRICAWLPSLTMIAINMQARALIEWRNNCNVNIQELE